MATTVSSKELVCQTDSDQTTIEMASKCGLILEGIDLLILDQTRKTGISKNNKPYTVILTLLTDGIEYVVMTEFFTSKLLKFGIGNY